MTASLVCKIVLIFKYNSIQFLRNSRGCIGNSSFVWCVFFNILQDWLNLSHALRGVEAICTYDLDQRVYYSKMFSPIHAYEIRIRKLCLNNRISDAFRKCAHCAVSILKTVLGIEIKVSIYLHFQKAT